MLIFLLIHPPFPWPKSEDALNLPLENVIRNATERYHMELNGNMTIRVC